MAFRKTYERVPVRMVDFDESRTEQEWKDGCDIRNILRHYSQTGDWNLLELPPRRIMPNEDLQEFTMDEDIQSHLMHLDAANELISSVTAEFNRLPAADRARYNNDVFAYAKDMAVKASAQVQLSTADGQHETKTIEETKPKVEEKPKD